MSLEQTPLLGYRATQTGVFGKLTKYVPLIIATLAVSALNSVTWKRTLNAFRNVDDPETSLAFFVNNMCQLIYTVLAAAVLLYRWVFTDTLSKAQFNFPQRKFVAMASMDAASTTFSAIGGATVAGQVQTLLNQATIPITMALSSCALGTKYAKMQYVGAALVLIGAAAASIPATSSGGTSTLLSGLIIYTLSTFPASLSNVYKEVQFRGDVLDVYYLTTCVSVYQLVIGVAMLPLTMLPGFGGIPAGQMLNQLTEGWSCLVGQHVPHYDCTAFPGPGAMLMTYTLVNFAYNILLLMITKHCSAMLLVIISAVSLPLTNLALSMPLLMGEEAETFDVYSLFGVGIVTVGFLLYSLVPEETTGEVLPVQANPGTMMYVPESFAATEHEKQRAAILTCVSLTGKSKSKNKSKPHKSMIGLGDTNGNGNESDNENGYR